MASFILIRHGNTDMVGRVLSGRMPGVHLNAEGRMQALELAERLADIPISAICSSPIERAYETAQPIAEKKRLEIEIREGLSEVDCGELTGLNFDTLEPDERLRLFNSFRTGSRIPGGEHVMEVQKRMVGEIESLRRRDPRGLIALFSHADPIKTAIAYYAGMNLDSWDRIMISTGSVSLLVVEDHGSCIHCLNNTGKLLIP